MAEWRAEGRDVVSLPQMTVHDLADRLESRRNGLGVLDVRADDEWAEGHIPGAVHRFAGELAQGAAVPVNGAMDIAVVCGSGYRSSVVASLLQQRGHRNLINVTGGMTAWNEAGLPTTQSGTRGR
jgi:hydroxyacylglutathione hydrolase